MGMRGEIFTLGTLLYVDSLYVGFRSLEPQERGKKKWWVGYLGICGDKGGYRGKFDPINSVVYRDPILMIGTLRALGRTVA